MGIWFSDGHAKEGEQLSKYQTYLNGYHMTFKIQTMLWCYDIDLLGISLLDIDLPDIGLPDTDFPNIEGDLVTNISWCP